MTETEPGTVGEPPDSLSVRRLTASDLATESAAPTRTRFRTNGVRFEAGSATPDTRPTP